MIEYATLLVAALAVLAVGWLAAERLAASRLAVRDRVVVNLGTGHALTGVLWRRAGRHLVLRDASLMEPGASKAQPMDGETIVDRAEVLFVQRLGR